MANAHTNDSKWCPDGRDVIGSREAILKYWTPAGQGKSRTDHHKITPEEITTTGDAADDRAYYEGTTKREVGSKIH